MINQSEKFYMNVHTGSVDVASGWDSLEGLTEVVWDDATEYWVEA